MARKSYKAEEIVSKLRQVDVLVSQGTKVPDAVRSIGVTDVTYYRWRREYGGLQLDQVMFFKARRGSHGVDAYSRRFATIRTAISRDLQSLWASGHLGVEYS